PRPPPRSTLFPYTTLFRSTPLTALKGGLEVALRAERSPEEYRRVLAGSLEEVERLGRLAEDLLALSRASAVPESRRDRVDLETRSEEHTSELQSRRDLVCR